jgi:hypothetical protein
MSDESADGVDLTLIHWMLSLSPAERLDVLQRFVDSVEALRRRDDVVLPLEHRARGRDESAGRAKPASTFD